MVLSCTLVGGIFPTTSNSSSLAEILWREGLKNSSVAVCILIFFRGGDGVRREVAEEGVRSDAEDFDDDVGWE